MEISSNTIVPVIDLIKFENSDSLLEYKKLREASEEWGCFRIINHGISKDLMAEMKSVARCLLDRPMEIKMCNSDVIPKSGYMAPSETNPLYESLGLYDFQSPERFRTFCDELHATPHQREVIEEYTKAMHELGVEIGKKFAKIVGFEGELFKGWTCLIRINKYNFTPESVGSSGVQIHTDSGFLTILQEDENVGGLEIMNKFGHLMAVDPCPGTLLLNLGDVAKAWSNGRFLNVKHRVQCKEGAIRISIASFVLGPKEKVIESPCELIDDQHPRLYLPFTFKDYRKLRFDTNHQDGQALELLQVNPTRIA